MARAVALGASLLGLLLGWHAAATVMLVLAVIGAGAIATHLSDFRHAEDEAFLHSQGYILLDSDRLDYHQGSRHCTVASASVIDVHLDDGLCVVKARDAQDTERVLRWHIGMIDRGQVLAIIDQFKATQEQGK